MKLRFKYQLILYYIVVMAIVIAAFLIYILQQSKNFKLTSIREQLISYNESVYSAYMEGTLTSSIEHSNDLRYTIIDTNFNIICFSGPEERRLEELKDSKAELIEASIYGEGTALRFSEEKKVEYLYYAKKYPGFYVRTSTPYIYEKIEITHHNIEYQYAILVLILALVITLIYISRKLTKPLKAFNDFFILVKSNKKDFSQVTFPNNEYGDIGRKIVNTYEQLEQAKLFKQQLTNNIAHELKTPLTGMRAYLETIINDESMSPEQMKKFVQMAYKQSIRLSSLVNDVSVLNKLDEQSEYYKIEEINISSCLKEIVEELSFKMKKNNTTFSSRISSELTIRSSHDIIYSLFKNLIDNTLEHAGPNTDICIMAGISQISGEANYRILFTYTDNGKGIPHSALDKLFDRFYRIEEGRARKSGGSGLGLAIVKNSVLFHKGNITVEHNPGGGVIFKFDLMSL